MDIRSTFQRVKEIDANVHQLLLKRFPKLMERVETALVWLVDGLLAAPLFAVVLALLLVVLGMTNPRSVATIAVALACLISFCGIARSAPIKRLTILSRSIVLAFIAASVAVSGTSFAHWALAQYELQHVGKIHMVRFVPTDVEAGRIPELNIYYENTGDSQVYFRAMSSFLVIGGLLTHPASDLKVTEESLFTNLTRDMDTKKPGEILNVSPHGSSWFTMPAPGSMVVDDIRNIDSGDALILTTGILRYEKQKNVPDVEFCVLWGRKDKVVITCPIHNTEWNPLTSLN